MGGACASSGWGGLLFAYVPVWGGEVGLVGAFRGARRAHITRSSGS